MSTVAPSSVCQELAVIILNWNAAADTIRCCREIGAWRELRPTIWVVDNGSVDSSPAAIREACPDVRLIGNPDNLGFAGGNNRAIAAALAQGDAPLLLLNNDATIEEHDVRQLLAALETDPRLGFVGPLLFDARERTRLLAAGGRSPVLYHHSHAPQLLDAGTPQRVDYAPGTVLLARAAALRAVGLLDEDYFFTMEVADLCMRARQHGYFSAVDPRARAWHALERSAGLRETLHSYYIIRNRFLLIRKLYARWRLPLTAFWAVYSLALAAKLALTGQRAAAQAVWLGLGDGLRGRLGGQNERVLAACAARERSAR